MLLLRASMAASLGVVLLPLGGCSACDAVSCGSGFSIGVQRDGGLAPGRYTVAATFDGEAAYTCLVDLDEPSEADCAGEIRPNISVTNSGTAKSLHLSGMLTPVVVDVTVEHDDVEVGSAEAVIDYSVNDPNGESCPGSCRNGYVIIDVGASP